MFKSFEYIGWSDASIKNNECYIAYGIKRVGETTFIHEEKFRVYDVTDSKEAEYLAAYTMLRGAAKEGFTNGIFYTDCARTWRDVMGIKEEYKTGKIKRYKQLFQSLLLEYPALENIAFHWEIRKANLAHRMFEDVSGWRGYTTAEIISENYPSVVGYDEIIQHIRSVEGTSYQILSSAHKDYFYLGGGLKHKGDLRYSFDLTEKSMVKNIGDAILYEENGQRVLVKSRLHMYLLGNIITRICLKESDLTKRWRAEKKVVPQNNKKEMSFKKVEELEPQKLVEVNSKIKVTRKALMKLSKTRLLDFDKEREELLDVFKAIVKKGKIEMREEFIILHYGQYHVQLQDNIITDLKIAA